MIVYPSHYVAASGLETSYIELNLIRDNFHPLVSNSASPRYIFFPSCKLGPLKNLKLVHFPFLFKSLEKSQKKLHVASSNDSGMFADVWKSDSSNG